MNGNTDPSAWHPVWPWLVAVLLMGGSQLFWLLRLQVDAGVASPVHQSPPPWHVLNTAAAENTTGWDRAQVWSPTLFALPDAVGFSDVLRGREIAVRPPVDSPPPMSLQLLERKRVGDAEYAVAGMDPQSFRRRLLQDSTVIGHPVSPVRPAEIPLESAGPQITLIESMPSRDMENAAWPVLEDGWGEQSWVAEGMLYVNAFGVVTHAILDMRPTEPEMKSQVLRALRAWRWSPAADESMVRIGLSYRAPSPGAQHGR